MKSSLPKIAYMLQMHKGPEQVNKFVKQLVSRNNADVYIHIDKKNFDKISGRIMKGPNIKVLEKSVDCEWGDISQVDATLLLLNEVVASQKNYDYICLRSGQDLLVKDGFEEFLLNNYGKIFLNYHSMDHALGFVEIKWPKCTRKRYTSAHPIRILRRVIQELHMRGINILPNKNYWPKEYAFYKGSQWFTIPFEVAKYIIQFLNDNEWFYRYYENSLISDESFFHTLILNSPYKEDVVNNNLLYLKWGETLAERNSPQYLTSEDIPKIESSNHYFARKFDESIDTLVVDYFAKKNMVGLSEKVIKDEHYVLVGERG